MPVSSLKPLMKKKIVDVKKLYLFEKTPEKVDKYAKNTGKQL